MNLSVPGVSCPVVACVHSMDISYIFCRWAFYFSVCSRDALSLLSTRTFPFPLLSASSALTGLCALPFIAPGNTSVRRQTCGLPLPFPSWRPPLSISPGKVRQVRFLSPLLSWCNPQPFSASQAFPLCCLLCLNPICQTCVAFFLVQIS